MTFMFPVELNVCPLKQRDDSFLVKGDVKHQWKDRGLFACTEFYKGRFQCSWHVSPVFWKWTPLQSATLFLLLVLITCVCTPGSSEHKPDNQRLLTDIPPMSLFVYLAKSACIQILSKQIFFPSSFVLLTQEWQNIIIPTPQLQNKYSRPLGGDKRYTGYQRRTFWVCVVP